MGKTFADRYTDCCALASGMPGLRASIPLAAHAMREFESILRTTLVGPMDAELASTKAETDRLEKAAGFLREQGFGDDPVKHAIDRLKAHTHADEIRAIAACLGFAPDAEVTKAWIDLNRMAGRAHKRSFHEELEVDEEFREEFQRPFDFVVRDVVLAIQSKYSAFMLRINELASDKDAGRALSFFEKEIPGAPTLQWYFFQTIQGPRWLKPILRSRFVHEPQLKLSEPDQGARSRQWPVAAYLRRMALDDPPARKLVANALQLVASSRHPDVRELGFDILSALPTDEAAALSDVLVGWLDERPHHGFLQKPVQMLAAFAERGHKDAAFSVARAAFRVFNKEGALATLHAQQMYEHHLPQVVKALAACDSTASVELFSGLLFETARITRKWSEEDDWTEHTPHPLTDSKMATYDVYDALIVAVRDSAYQVVAHAPADFPRVVQALYDRGPRIFKRIALQVLSRSPDLAPGSAAAYLTDKDLIGALWCQDEYAELAKAWFPNLQPAHQDEVFAVIDASSVNYRRWPAYFEEQNGRPPNADDLLRFQQEVFREATWEWRDALPAPRRKALDDIVQAIGDPHAWRNTYFRESVSPMSGDEFSSRPIEDIVAFLQSWQPQANPVRQTVSALGQQLQTAVQQTPERFIAYAAQLAAIRPIYVRRILEGLDTPARNSKGFSWNEALTLIERTIGRLDEPVGGVTLLEGDDKDWKWAAFAAADLLKTLLRRGDDALSNEQLPRIIRMIELLAAHAPRSPEQDNFEEQFKQHPSFTAERTLRGSVSDLCVLFLYWAAARKGAPLNAAPRTAMAEYGQIPTLLDAELADTSLDGRIPRAVLGRYLRNVHYFGEHWLRSRMQQLLPPHDEQLRRAAWSGHLLNDAGPLGPVMDGLVQSYEDEIARLPQVEAGDERSHRANRLSEYLVILFVNDLVPVELMQHFWTAASDRVRQHAMWFLGHHLLAAKDLKPDALTLARSYWDRRFTAAQAANDRAAFEKEIGAIGQWMHSQGIEEDWLASQLLRVVRAGFAPTNGYFVVEWLGKRAATDTDRAVATLQALLALPNLEPFVYVTDRESLRTILTHGREKGSPETVALVNDAVNRLASFGEAGYLDLLTPLP